MARPIPPNRRYSFDNNDETSLQPYPSEQPLRSYSPVSPFRDESPIRNIPAGYEPDDEYSNIPAPPAHRYSQASDPFHDGHEAQQQPQNLGYTQSTRTASTTTPGMDNFGQASVGGGLAGLAHGIASTHERESGLAASRGIPQEEYVPVGQQNPYIPDRPQRGSDESYGADSHLSGSYGDPHNGHYPARPVFADGPYKRYSAPWDPRVDAGEFDPENIADDGDDGLDQPASRRSMLSFGQQSRTSINRGAAAGAAGGAAGFYGEKVARSTKLEKAGFLAEEAAKRRKKRIFFIIAGVVVLLAVIAAAVVGGILGTRAENSSDGADAGGLYDKNSAQVQELLNNPDFKMVFPGMDYTPFNAQYPACLTNPPSQNNVTMDIAVLSQLTKTVRLYGTDCNQTDMVLQAFKQLDITDMKVWLGVWLDNNATTNARGMAAMYDIIDRNGPDMLAGVIIGNEVLFRQDLTVEQLTSVVAGVRSNFTAKKIDLPIGVADLGDNWAKDGKDFINDVDVVMSNIHPFFGGVPADQGAGWTWDFWQTNDIALTQGTNKQNIISEVGWPSQGGNDCGVGANGQNINCTSPTQGAIAGIDEMNTFMAAFVCESLTNKTDYFWFEAFDEPWKAQFNTPTEQWEDRWGLMTPDRQIKAGLNIPDCNGQTIS